MRLICGNESFLVERSGRNEHGTASGPGLAPRTVALPSSAVALLLAGELDRLGAERPFEDALAEARGGMNARVLPDPEALARAAAELVLEAEAAAGERFAICLTGGSTPQATHRLLASDEFRGRADWSRWHVFFGDERQVPLDDPRSNYQNARESLLDHVPIPAGQIHPLTDADQYEGLLRAFFGEAPRFDLLMLGMGDDGHTASLFPGSVSLLESERWVIAPPDVVQGMSRLTLTLPALDAARRTVFLVAGAAKADAIRRIRAGEQLPAGMVQGAEWLLDEAAAKGLASA